MPTDAYRLAVTVFATIFVAELPDKTALAALVLATRHRAAPVLLGAGLALSVQSLVAVAAGSLFALLPSRPVHLGAGVVFLVSAGVMIARKDDGPGTPQTGPGGDVPSSVGAFWRSFGTVFGVVFAAEWGDLTQLATAAFAARERMPVVIFCAATLALWAVTAIAVGLGNRAARVIRPVVAQRVAAALFAAIGVGLLVRG